MAMKGYHSYRGRQGTKRRSIVPVLVIILVLACAFLFLQRFVTFSDDGSFRLDLPVFDRLGIGDDTPDVSDEQKDPNVNLVIEDPKANESEKTDDTAEEEPPEPTPAPYAPRRLLGFSALPGDEAALIAELENFGADGFVFTAKADKGDVYYTSLVAPPAFVAGGAAESELLSAFCAVEQLYTVAKINCFHDSNYAFANMEAAGICQKNGYVWYDYSSNHWMDPEKEAARAYVIDLALECAQMGVDEILLEDMCYPPSGKLQKIDYSGNTMEKPDALVLFLSELRRELEPYGVRVSLVMEEAQLLGTADDTEKTGVVPEKLLPLVDAVYVETADVAAVETAVMQIMGAEKVPILIPIVTDETAAGGWYLPR